MGPTLGPGPGGPLLPSRHLSLNAHSCESEPGGNRQGDSAFDPGYSEIEGTDASPIHTVCRLQNSLIPWADSSLP
jgi:hypothetical protein